MNKVIDLLLKHGQDEIGLTLCKTEYEVVEVLVDRILDLEAEIVDLEDELHRYE